MLWGDVEEAIKAERLLRIQRIERLSTICALMCLTGAVWLAWPTLKDAFSGDAELLSGLGMPILVILWGIILQDLILDDPKARTRVGAACSMFWPLLMMFAIRSYGSEISEILAGVLLLGLGFAMLKGSANTLRGGIDVMRFRAMMTAIGGLTVLGVLVGDRAEGAWIASPSDWLHPILATGVLLHVAYLWVAGDNLRQERKAFRTELDRLESRILILRSQGAAVDQASSLVTTAKEEGHIDPAYGMRLLGEASEDIERSLSLAGDVDVVRTEALAIIEHAEDLTPLAKRPRKSYEMGQREASLGSLREAEALYRQAKIRAQEIVTWWAQAEGAINHANELLTGQSGAAINNMREIIRDARKQLEREAPKKAFELAVVIPIQLQVRRALRQRKKLLARFEGFSDSDKWMLRFTSVQKAADERQWSHAATLLERLTIDLDALGNEQDEADTLLTFVREEWAILRNQCEASNLPPTDEDMKNTDAAIALAADRLKEGQVADALEQLGQADAAMERLRRRV